MLHLRILPLLLAGAAACSVYEAPTCRSGADCVSGVCDADGFCAPQSGTGGASTSSASSGTGGGAACSPDGDGSITRQEVPLQAGLHATFRVAENASSVDTAGKAQPDGSRAWDLDLTFSGDHAEIIETLSLAGQWFAKDFPGATYAARLSDTSDLLGVFQLTDGELSLLGVASPASGPQQTELKYAPPVTVLSFPIQPNKTWSDNTMVTGQAQGIPVLYTESYQSTADAHGTLKTPFSSFPVQRIAVNLTRVVGALVTTKRTFAFVAECFGTVGTIVSHDDELVPEFTTAAEVSRLSP
jgi:hypothetical protein